MAFCKVCGNEMHDSAIVCTKCGVATSNYDNFTKPTNGIVDNGGFGWGLLGCCVPVAGLVLYLVWKNERPNTARAAGIGALVYVILVVLYFIAFFALGLASELSYY